ncbi:MAG: hypothetical protein AAGJ08_00950 [Cyanobacteria bacterium P01_H01_bin.35]
MTLRKICYTFMSAIAIFGNRELGAALEVIADGKTGFLCHNLDEMIAAVERVHQLDRNTCRQHVLDNFGVAKMVDGYEEVYRQLLEKRFATTNGHNNSKFKIINSKFKTITGGKTAKMVKSL